VCNIEAQAFGRWAWLRARGVIGMIG
jgi:hypothetical protein